MNTLQIILLVVCALLAILFIVARAMKGGLAALLLKTLASFGFVSSAIIGLGTSNLVGELQTPLILLTLGLLCGMIGDIVLDLKVIYDNDKIYLNAGMLSFFVGHIFYILSLSLLANNSISTPLLISLGVALILTTFITLSSKKMGLNFGKFLIQTIAYTLILTFAMTYSLILAIMNMGSWIVFVGLLLFFASDIVLSFQYFGGKISNKFLIIINHLLYYAAQIIIVATLFLI